MHPFFVANYEEHLHSAFWNCPVLHCSPGNGLHHHFSEKITRFGWRRNHLNQDLVLACVVIPLSFKDLNRIKSFLVWFIWSEWQGLGALPLSLYSPVGWCRSVKRFWVDLQYQILQLQRAGVVISHEQVTPGATFEIFCMWYDVMPRTRDWGLYNWKNSSEGRCSNTFCHLSLAFYDEYWANRQQTTDNSSGSNICYQGLPKS